jgi:hypothetical protein
VAVALLCCACFGREAAGQVSPGPLSKPHQFLEGPTQCISCHRLAAGSGSLKCLECHTEIAQRVSARTGFHASVLGPRSTSRDCVRCHSEHNGERFQLVHWEPSEKAFDHSKTGYPLEGKHATLSCLQCHNAGHISPAERGSIKVKDLNRTYLGLSRACITCHTDEHQGRLGKDCQQCHSLNDWKMVSQFDHSKTRYPLTGAHAEVGCQKCHKTEGPDGKVKYFGLAFASCAACHSDPHRGAFKSTCESCHTTAGWKRVSTASVSARFDHSKTRYPLLGRHAGAACNACHVGGDFTRPVAHDKCADCHKDAHRGQFLARKDGSDCAACHTVDGFKPSTYGVKEHAATTYALLGKHASVQCDKCHLPAGEATVFKIKATQCKDCHKDVHQGQFEGNAGRCESCHTVHGFSPSTYTLARHQTTRFMLTGGHLAVACIDCHQAQKLPGTSDPVPYHFKDLSCETCHTDPHHGEFADRMRAPRADGKPAGCEACHSTKAWSDLARFDHSTTRFVLLGTHRAVACADCHKPGNLETTPKNVKFNSAPLKCQGCHEDPHAGQFARDEKVPGCVECHNTAKWRPSLFDHETQTEFPLRGAHQNVSCGQCHQTSHEVDGKQVIFYRPTPKQCVACHGPDEPKAPGGAQL